jgi:hypothetical protein
VDLAPSKRSKKQKNKEFWPVKVFFLTFALAMLISFFSQTTLLGVSLPVALLVLFCIILIGIISDIVGIAVTYENVTAYTAMASKRIRGARQAIRLVQSADTVSNICNDVVGDICGIVSGAMGAAIAARLIVSASQIGDLLSGIGVSSLIAAMTVGGKAVGKKIAVRHSHEVVFALGRVLAVASPDEKSAKKAGGRKG